MTIPYMSAVGGLLRHAKRQAGIEDEEDERLRPTPPWNPNANPVQASMQGLLAQNLGQNPVMGDGPGLLQRGAPEQIPDHDHKRGIGGRLRHLFGADRIDPSVAEILEPDQKRRLLDKSTLGLLFAGGSEAAAQDMVRLRGQALEMQDAKAARGVAARQEQDWRNIQLRSGPRPQDPAAAAAWMTSLAQEAAGLGLPQAKELVDAANRLQPRPMQERATAKMTILAPDGNHYAIQQDAYGEEVPGSRVRVPKPTSGITYKEGVGPGGEAVIYALPSEEGGDLRGSVAPRATGVTVPAPVRGDPMTIKVINNERTLAYDDAQLSIGAIGDGKGGIRNPPGNWDRVMTKSEWTNVLASQGGQHYLNNVKKLIRSWVVLIEGKRMSDADARVNELQRSFAIGDKSIVVEGKKQTLLSMAASIAKLKTDGGITRPVPGEAAERDRAADLLKAYGLTPRSP